MIPLLRHRVFIALSENAQKTHKHRQHSSTHQTHKSNHHSQKKGLSPSEISLRNLRRVNRLREKKLKEEKEITLRNALSKQIHLNKLTKKEMEERIILLQNHLEIYKNKFESITKEQHALLTKRELQERLGSLVLIEKQLLTAKDIIETLEEKKKISAKEQYSLKEMTDKLEKTLKNKKRRIQKEITELEEKTRAKTK